LSGKPGWSKENGKVTKAYLSLLTSTLLFLLAAPAAHSQVVPGCARDADEATRVETARAILRVNGRVDPITGAQDVDHYHKVINFWAEQGSGEDGDGVDGAVYQESILSNATRQEMWDYLEYIFTEFSSDMELVVLDELWESYPDGSMTYMNVNRWFGSTSGGYYEQPGISIVKFRPGEGCASYQRDYFSEGDTWWGIAPLQAGVRSKREKAITNLGLTDRCIDDDGDGYSKYTTATGCSNPGLDCDDYKSNINPGAVEIPASGLDENCNGSVDE
jgi:Putative metal-binding motif